MLNYFKGDILKQNKQSSKKLRGKIKKLKAKLKKALKDRDYWADDLL